MPPQSQPQEIEATFLREFYRKDEFFVGEILPETGGNGNGNNDGSGDDHGAAACPVSGEHVLLSTPFRKSPANAIKVKGESPPETAPVPGMVYRFYGKFEMHPKYGESFSIRTFTPSIPHEHDGVIRYLQQIKGIGQAAAEAAWNKFGADAVKVLREHPDKASAVLGKRYSRIATEAAEKLQQMAGLEGVTVDLMSLLDGHNLPRKTLQKAIAKWGNRATEIIKHNPYRLLAFGGIGFKKADALYKSLGLPPNKLKRQGLCMLDSVMRDTSGSTWFPVDVAVKGLHENISGAPVQPVRAMRFAKRAKLLSIRKVRDNATGDGIGAGAGVDRYWVADSKKARSEGYVAKRVAQMMLSRDSDPWPDVGKLVRASNHQRSALEKAFHVGGDLVILRGSPGVGKTLTAGDLAQVIVESQSEYEVAFCAPTGKAAVRLTQAMQDNGVPIRATTIHSLLGVMAAPNEDDKEGGWAFTYNAWNPLPYKYVICDEFSMTGTGLFSSLLSAIAPGSKLLIIGDTGQLPPVEYGAPLRDLIDAGVPTATLTEIWRNSGTIVHACHAIAAKSQIIPIDAPEQINPNTVPPRNLGLVGAPNGEIAADRIIERLCAIRDRGLCDPIWGAQVLVAVNRKSPLSRQSLNSRLQEVLNPNGERCADSPFRVGDKVIQTKNGMLNSAGKKPGRKAGADGDDGKVFVANGDIGRVVEVRDKSTVVAFAGVEERVVLVPKGKGKNGNGSKGKGGNGTGGNGENENGNGNGENGDGNDDDTNTGCKLDLAYAITGHKSQGSEFPVVMFALDETPGALMVASRQWAYTCISRAKKLCLMFGKRSTLDRMRRKDAIAGRKTFLVEGIRNHLK